MSNLLEIMIQQRYLHLAHDRHVGLPEPKPTVWPSVLAPVVVVCVSNCVLSYSVFGCRVRLFFALL
jgi:hypothetical protein